MEHELLATADAAGAGGSWISRRPLLIVLVAGVAGAGSGALARALAVYGSRPISLIGAGLALWITLAFAFGRLAPTLVMAVVECGAFLACWLAGYYFTDAQLLAVPLSTMWPVARPWVILLVPAGLAIGLAANRSRRAGRLGDVALALPLVWSLAEGLFDVRRHPAGTGLVVCALLVASAVVVVAVERRGRVVSLVTVAAAAVVCAVPFAVVAFVLLSPVN